MGNSGLFGCCGMDHSVLFERSKLTERELRSTINPRKRQKLNEPLHNIKEQGNEEYSCESFEDYDFTDTVDQAAFNDARTTVTRLSIGECRKCSARLG